ncbi:Pleiotropic regulatory protein [Marinitoga sp. 1135]|uniref:Putative PLP-dependent enzyme possibly involved in cell wall biogenesis n=1 Tax=Marinitoga piezophila (strain DSM 14283 / JCM 11233 / KA3) TaxID=443254 RepID=H2J3W4_MARPK|nr:MULTISPECIES: DegT/DnrJ/EryC1/StrS family aminotransferase [Marinitoga]AEX85856.1 putative PLP-dependent enzyme possibly involved in cell wall biogenesis [Marinitoga piezophila KA3]APT76294.1 Pleiotropic regulatory protein [Marinitoga sp. 1137]NUU96059.1 Pleiotropic regulatory protein [Marinitoga sp. 1135]NUU97970.1 Pleiotropic regulatory protein [Marinitoga sp. 1138]
MKIPLFDMTRQYEKIREEVLETLDNIFKTGKVILGPHVKALEEELAEYAGTKYAIGVANGSDALFLSVRALNIGEGDYVITTPYTFFATASCITRNGAKPIFVDVEEKYYNMDLNKVEEILKNHPEREKIKAIIPVHLFGKTIDLERLQYFKEKYGVYIIEDGAQSIGSMWKGKKGFSVGDLSITSFFPTKNLGGYGDGGMVFTNNEELATRVRKLRVHGAAKKYYHDEVGFNSRLDEVQAAILRIKLKHLDEYIENRIKIAKKYDELFKAYKLEKYVEYPGVFEDKSHVYHQYVITLKKGNRDELREYLTEKGIGTSIYYPKGLHEQKCFEYLGYKKGDFPITEKATETTLALPIFPELTENEVEYIVESIKEYFNN